MTNALLLRRRGMMVAKSLPYDAEVEYLKGDGSAYIDTGIKGGGNIIVRTSFYKDSVPSGSWVFGGIDGFGTRMFGVYHRGTSEDMRFAYSNSYYITGLYANLPDVVNVEIGNGVCTIGGASVNYPISTFTVNTNIILFGLRAGSTYYFSSTLRLKSFYIKKGSLELDLIPVRVGTVGYMYDRISRQLIVNAGTGAFVLGPDIQ